MIRLFDISEKALNEYRSTVRGRDLISKEKAQKVLTRNIILCDAFHHTHYSHYYYGALRMTVNKQNKIIHIKNNTRHRGRINKVAKKLLNEVLDI